MTPRLADVPTRVDPPATSSPKHPFNRDPLLIPQLFIDMKVPWYRRPTTVVGFGICAVMLLVIGAAIRVYTFEGLMRKFAALASR